MGRATVEPYLEKAHDFGPYATLSEALPVLATGRPVYLGTARGFASIMPQAAVGQSASRRLIDLPSTYVAPARISTPIAEVLRHHKSTPWVPVVEDGVLRGQVRISRLGSDLAGLRREVAATLGHDINNVLMVIQAFLGSARSGAPDTEQLLEQADAALAHGQELARRLLDWSRADAPLAEPVHIDAVLQGLVPWIARVVPDVRVELDVDEGLPPAISDRANVERIVLNLVLNAAEAPGCTRVTVRARLDGDLLSIRVEDDGDGIPEEVRESIFDAGTSSKAGQGRGFGLSAVLHSTAGSGGELVLEETGAGGTVFRLDLPTA